MTIQQMHLNRVLRRYKNAAKKFKDTPSIKNMERCLNQQTRLIRAIAIYEGYERIRITQQFMRLTQPPGHTPPGGVAIPGGDGLPCQEEGIVTGCR